MAEDNKDPRQTPKPPPLPPSLSGAVPLVPEKVDPEKRIADLEKRLAEEHEKLLVAHLKSQEESANAARVEMSIRELQEKLRRDRRAAEDEEARRSLAAKIQELEARLVHERETWVAALKNQMQGRETQEHEVETHFAKRLEELERRWLNEKALWQKAALSKDEEIRQLRASGDKLRDAEMALSKAATERKFLEERLGEFTRARAEDAVHVQNAVQKEKEAIELKGELALARQQCAALEARLDRELGALRAALREREERLASLNERLTAEHEANLRQVRAESASEVLKQKEATEGVVQENRRLKAVTGALEKQLAAARTQSEELKRAAVQWEQAQERAKAEFVVIQRRWTQREQEIRSEAGAQAQEKFQAQLGRLKLAAQEEINQRLSRVAQEKEELQRLSTAQAAQIRALEDALRRLRP